MKKRLLSGDTRSTGVSKPQQEYSRILTAAVINTHFRQMLLNNPAQAINAGYAGEAFHLPVEDKKRVSSIRASSLAEFASQLVHPVEFQGMPAFSIGD
jgi:hypothetical protein